MRRVKRLAVRVTPTAPYIDWANGLEEGDVKLGSEDMPDGNIYLVADNDDLDLARMLEPHDAAI